MIDILVVLLKPALVWESNPWRYWWLTPLVLVAFIADVVAAHTSWAVIAGWPKKGEWTISHTLERLVQESPDPFYKALAMKINSISFPNKHIKGV